MNADQITPSQRTFITIATVVATMMSALDGTIANVALPHIQGSVSASREEITWVLTSYIVAAAIVTPLTGWLAGRFGRKRLMLVSVVGFTIVSGACGLATNLDELVLFRLLQGMFGAALVPMSQAILLDINPPERHGPAMAMWSAGAVLGPIIGPTLGGYLTDNFSWRWVFYVNLPIGLLALAGLALFLPESRDETPPRLDLIGFALLTLLIGSLQLLLDRGQQQDWFSSVEIQIYAFLIVGSAYFFLVHTLTAPAPFIKLAIFADRNFTLGAVLGFFIGVYIYGVLALLPPMLEQLMGYPVMLTGLVTAPRGVGTMVMMLMVGRLVNRIDARVLVLAGLGMCVLSMYQLSGVSLAMDSRIIIVSGIIQGTGTALVFVPLSTMVFSTLQPTLRNEGSAMYTLIRNIGSAVGISVLQTMTIRNGAIVHSRLIEGIRPDNPAMDLRQPGFDYSLPSAVARLDAEVVRQASMVAYTDVFWALTLLGFAIAPLLLFMRKAKAKPGERHAIEVD